MGNELSSRAAGIAVLVAVTCGLASPVAQAQLPASISVSATPATLYWPGNTGARYTVSLQTDAQPAAFGIHWRENGIASFLALDDIQYSGPGVVRPIHAAVPAVAELAPCGRGQFDSTQFAAWIEIPADSTSSLMLTGRIADPPWLGDVDGVQFATYLDEQGPFEDTPLITPAVDVSGKFGVRFRFGKRPLNESEKAAKIVVKGSTSPKISPRFLRFRAIPIPGLVSLKRWRAKGSLPLGEAERTMGGGFRLIAPRPTEPGTYRVLARSVKRGPNLVPDWDCGPVFSVAQPEKGG